MYIVTYNKDSAHFVVIFSAECLSAAACLAGNSMFRLS